MKAPDKIYRSYFYAEGAEVFQSSPAEDADICNEYIRKDLLLEWAQEQYEFYKRVDADFSGTVFVGNRQAFADMINKLNTL